MSRRYVFILLVFAACITTLLNSQTSVLTWHNNNWRDGLNSTETVLNQTNVTPKQFGKLCSAVFDGQVYGQPLVVSSGASSTVYVATMNDSVYSVNGTNCQIINHVSLLESGEEAMQCTDVGGGQCHMMSPTLGVLGTPVIDPTTNTIYVVSEAESNSGQCAAGPAKKPPSCYVDRIHALDLTTLAEKFSGPVVIAGSFGKTSYTAFNHNQRPGLLLLEGAMANGDSGVYVGLSSIGGSGAPGVNVPSGWVFGYDAQNLGATPYSWIATLDGEGGGVWASGAGIAAGLDSPGGSTYLYLVTGDGDFNANTGGMDYGDSFVKLTANLQPSSYFTPFAQACMNPEDDDFGSGGAMLIPDSGSTYFAVATSKPGVVYAMNRANPGGYKPPRNSTCPAVGKNLDLEYFLGSTHQYYTTPVTWNSQMYTVAMYDQIAKYQLNLGTAVCHSAPICTNNIAKTSVILQYGTNLSLSSSGVTTGTAILWAAAGNGWPTATAPASAILYAFDAEHVTASTIPELWDSTKCPTRDKPGNGTKFVLPTIANGFVYLGSMDPTDTTNTRGELDVFGLTTATCN
ncbi:MAG TPA: hypothetical protein VK722_12965 [Candidatus Aquilonibacter sp.]|jgi:hypothetical protein|nr:hypothetical protein [Candidatus Aquilonibacter sp.]